MEKQVIVERKCMPWDIVAPGKVTLAHMHGNHKHMF